MQQLPPILQALQMQPQQAQTQNQSPFLDKIKQAAAAYRNIQNPQQYIQNEIMKNNPLMKNVMEEIQANGGNAQAAFYAYAQKMGVDPNEILNMMKGQ